MMSGDDLVEAAEDRTDCFDLLDENFPGGLTFASPTGGPAINVVAGDPPVLLVFADLPLAVIHAIPGRRVCEVVGHPAFAPGTRNGGIEIIDVVTTRSRDRGVGVLAMALSAMPGPVEAAR